MDLVELYVEVRHTTDDAYLVHDGDRDAWIPKSQVHSINFKGEATAYIEIPEWLAIEKELV